MLQPGLDGLQALLFDGRGVEVARIDIASLAALNVLFGLQNQFHPILGQIVECGEHAIVGLVGRNLGFLGPFAIGIEIEIVGGRYAGIHAFTIKAIGAKLWAAFGCCFCFLR